MRKFPSLPIFIIAAAVLLATSCQSKSSIESTPVEAIEVSAPPVEDPAPAPVVLYDDFGIRLPDEWRLYGAIVPKGYKDVERSDKDTRFYTDSMTLRDVEVFLDKYFPYQPREYSDVYRMYEVMPWIKDIYKEGGIVPDLNPNVYRPEQPIYLRISFDKSRQEILWIYRDPGLYERQQEQFGAKCKTCGQQGQQQNDEPSEPREEEMTADQVAKICDLCRNADPNDPKTMKEACSTCQRNAKNFDTYTIEKYQLTANPSMRKAP